MHTELFLFKHPAMRTVAFKVLKTFYVKEKCLWKLKVEWYKISTLRPPERTSFKEWIELTRSKWKEFEPIPIGAKVDIPTQFQVVIDDAGRIQEFDLRELTPVGSSFVQTTDDDSDPDSGDVG